MKLEELYKKLKLRLSFDIETACRLFYGSITSYGRSVTHNRALSGASTSWHLDWLAFDVWLDNYSTAGAFQQYLQNLGYRVLSTGGIKRGKSRAFHVQYAWNIIKDFERVDHLTHLKVMVQRLPKLFEEYGDIEIDEG